MLGNRATLRRPLAGALDASRHRLDKKRQEAGWRKRFQSVTPPALPSGGQCRRGRLEVHMRVPSLASLVAVVCLSASSALAMPPDRVTALSRPCSAEVPPPDPWAVVFGTAAPSPRPASLRLAVADEQVPAARRPVAFEYSEGYKTRAKIHKISSFATLPLFVANYLVAQDLYNNPGNESKKGLHVGLAASTGVLFGVNTFTGGWNLWEGRKDHNHRGKRVTHGILMIAADFGFLATAMLAPEFEEEEEHSSGVSDPAHQASTHRAVALTSMGVATVSYLIMLLGGR